jgi:hypothetical protein
MFYQRKSPPIEAWRGWRLMTLKMRLPALQRAGQDVNVLQQTSQSTQLATPAFAQMTPSLKEPVCEPIGRTSKGRADASLYWPLVVVLSFFSMASRYFAPQNTAHYSIIRSMMAPRPLSASNRRGIVRFGGRHYLGGHRSWT